jgi:hypothetical protein
MQTEQFVEETLPPECGFGSFNKILVQSRSDKFTYPGIRTKVRIEHESLPQSKGYQNLHGREHRVFYKQDLIAILHTEDCGLGSSKARQFLHLRGFKLA